MPSKYEKYLSIFLWLVTFHSILVGFGLLFIPSSFLNNFGFNYYKENFFQAQGGIFHIGLSISYCMAALKPNESIPIIKFIISIKLLAFLFLIIYFILISHNYIILLSGLCDGLMGVIILMLLRLNTNSKI